jgi:hypothetical protein
MLNKRYEKQLDEAKEKLLPKIGKPIERGGFVLTKTKRTVFHDVTLETAKRFHATRTTIDTGKLLEAMKLGAKVSGVAYTEYINVKNVLA